MSLERKIQQKSHVTPETTKDSLVPSYLESQVELYADQCSGHEPWIDDLRGLRVALEGRGKLKDGKCQCPKCRGV